MDYQGSSQKATKLLSEHAVYLIISVPNLSLYVN